MYGIITNKTNKPPLTIPYSPDATSHSVGITVRLSYVGLIRAEFKYEA